MRLKINYNNDNLFCVYSKLRIEIGEKYAEVQEQDVDGEYTKAYKLEYAPEENDDEDPYIASDDFPVNADLE